MPPEPSPTEILQRVQRAYGACRTYRDTGEVRTEHPGASYETVLRFTTAFVRPDRLLMQFGRNAVGPRTERVASFILWNAEGVRSHAAAFDDVHAPLHLAAGPSGGASTIVPFLLLAGTSGHLPGPGPGLGLRGREGTTWVLEGKGPGPTSTTWWIDHETFLLRRRRHVHRNRRLESRLRRELRGPLGPRTRERFEQTLAAAPQEPPLRVVDITWEPVLDEPIPGETFDLPRA